MRYAAVAPVSVLLCFLMLLIPQGAASGDVIFLDGGGKLKGSIVQANANIVIVQRPSGGIQQIARKRIAEISADLKDGREIVGEFEGWSNGVLRLNTEAGVVRIRSGSVLDGDDEPVETASLAESTADLTGGAPRLSRQPSYVPPPIFSLNNGAAITGRPIAHQSPLLTIRRASGGQQTLRVNDVKEVVVRTADGGSIVGEFIDWSDGVFELRVDDQLVRVSQGAIFGEAVSDASIGGPLENLPETTGDGATEVAIATGTASSSDGSDTILLSVTNRPALEHEAAMVFNVNLSRPTPRDLIIIYTTLAGTADQEDFTDGSGVAKIVAGSDNGQITIPLVDDEIKEGDESLSLFLSSDPKLIKMASNRIAATIKDND